MKLFSRFLFHTQKGSPTSCCRRRRCFSHLFTAGFPFPPAQRQSRRCMPPLSLHRSAATLKSRLGWKTLGCVSELLTRSSASMMVSACEPGRNSYFPFTLISVVKLQTVHEASQEGRLQAFTNRLERFTSRLLHEDEAEPLDVSVP